MAEVHHPFSLGETAENVADQWKVSREDQDAFALESQQKAAAALAAGRLAAEIVPVTIPQRSGNPVVVTTDEHPRPDTTLEKLGKLPPAFRKGGSVTAGNSSGVNDGAAALLLLSAQKAEALGIQPLARIRSMAVAGVDQIDLVELHEAFASQAFACRRELGFDPERVNVNGGAIALGHPLGCSGARIMTTLVHEMRRRQARYGLATMCIGVGQGIATVVERL